MNSLRTCMNTVLRSQNFICTNYMAMRHIRRTLRPTLVDLTRIKKQKNNYKPVEKIRQNFIDWNRNSEIYSFNARLSEKFDLQLLEKAFTHKSYIEKEEAERTKMGLQEIKIDIEHNEKLVEEGKEILPKIIERYLSKALPYAPKECILAFVNYLLKTDHLAYTSSGIGTKDLILCSTHPVPKTLLAETFYALVAALKNSVDLNHVSIFVRDILISTLAEKDLTEIWCPEDPLDVLNDILLRNGRELIEPRLAAQTASNTLLATYQVALYSNQEFLGIGVGNTIDEATNVAAIITLMNLFRLLDCYEPLRCNLKVSGNLEEPILNKSLKEWSLSNFTV